MLSCNTRQLVIPFPPPITRRVCFTGSYHHRKTLISCVRLCVISTVPNTVVVTVGLQRTPDPPAPATRGGPLNSTNRAAVRQTSVPASSPDSCTILLTDDETRVLSYMTLTGDLTAHLYYGRSFVCLVRSRSTYLLWLWVYKAPDVGPSL